MALTFSLKSAYLAILLALNLLTITPSLSWAIERVSLKKYPQLSIKVPNPMVTSKLPARKTFQVNHKNFVLQFFFNERDIFGYILKRNKKIPIHFRWCFFRSCEESPYDFKKVIAELKTAGNCVLFIDEMHTMVGAGAAEGAVDAANILKPSLARGELQVVGATTQDDYRKYVERDPALERRFQPVVVDAPDAITTVEILRGVKHMYEKHHDLEILDEALETAATLADRYIADRQLPDKAIDVLDEVGASRMLLPEGKRKKTISVKDVENVVAKMARIPPKTVSQNDKKTLSNLKADLRRLVYGQDRAIEALSSAIKLSRAGLREPEKPIGSYLFSGPTGVGKTEVARQLAHSMGIELVRFDMSEYMERHTVSRLIGAPPGYVGFDQGGLLTDAIDKQPHSVLLLDEIEKAHPDLFNILLQVMDHGKLTDHNGKSVDFRNVVIIMTTNAGAFEMAKAAVGFERNEREGDDEEAIERMFSPEFRNRLDAVIPFSNLPPKVMSKVVDKFIMELEAQLSDRDVTINLTHHSRKWLAKKGYSRRFGARPLARVIQEHIKKPLSEELLFGALTKGGIVLVGVKDNSLTFKYPKSQIPKKGQMKKLGSRHDPSNDSEGSGGKKPALVD